MAQNTVQVSIRVRNDTAERWNSVDPTLAMGEFGLESDTLKLKIGDGHTAWHSLTYITSNSSGSNTFDPTYFTTDVNGNITFVASFANALVTKDSNNIVNDLLVNTPGNNANGLSAVNKTYVDQKIQTAIDGTNHLKRIIVDDLPFPAEAEDNTIYMVLDPNIENGDRYKDWMLINGSFVLIGDTSVNLKNLISGATKTPGHLVAIGDGNSLIDSGYEASRLEIATSTTLGVVKSGNGSQTKSDPGYNHIIVDNSGFMTVNHVSTTTLYVPDGDQLILNGGSA